MQIEAISREQVIELAKVLPPDKLVRWYEFGLFIQHQPLFIPDHNLQRIMEDDLAEELRAWDLASDEDLITFEKTLLEPA